MSREPRTDRLVALALLGVTALAAGLEGSVVRMYGGAVVVLAVAVALPWVWSRGVDPLPKAAKLGLFLLGLTLAWQVLPVPNALRALLAPGQATWIDLGAPEWSGSLDPWLRALAQHDVLAAIDSAGPWAYDALDGARAGVTRIGALAPEAWVWNVAQIGAAVLLYFVGARLGRSDSGTRTFFVGMLLLAVAEAVFGLANRDGPSTGIGVKQHYLGSATGTFINRGHFGAFLALGAGCAWALAANLFPLTPEEVRKHRQRSRRSSQPPSVLEASGDRIPRLALLAFAAAVLMVALAASQSRGPVASLAVAGLVIGTWAWRRRKEPFHFGIAVALPAVGGVLAMLAFGPRGAFGRFLGLLGGGDVSVSSRLDVWRASLGAWTDAPVFGAGLGGWPLAYALHERGDHLWAFAFAHDEPLQLLVELGAVGFFGCAVVGFAALRGLARALSTVPHEDGAGAAIGALVGCGAVLVQSLGDFPLHILGVLVPFSILAGIASGSLGGGEGGGRRLPVAAIGLVAAALGAWSAWDDHDFVGTRDDRLSERGEIWNDPGRSATDRPTVLAWTERARAAASWTPLDPWGHAAVAEGEARLAAEGWRKGGSRDPGDAPEDHAFQADLALTRALRLRPRAPRIEVESAYALVILARESPTPDAFRSRAVDLLADAVARDPWRAEDAFKVAQDLPASALARIDAAAKGEPRFLARVHYSYGKALEQRGLKDQALAAYESAMATDAKYAPALFSAAVLLRPKSPDAADTLLRQFLVAEERPGGMEGWALLTLGEVDQAKVRFRRLVDATPGNRWAWEGLAEASKRKGEVEDERMALQRILAMDPGHRMAKERLAALDAGK